MAANIGVSVCFSATVEAIGEWAAADFVEAAPASMF